MTFLYYMIRLLWIFSHQNHQRSLLCQKTLLMNWIKLMTLTLNPHPLPNPFILIFYNLNVKTNLHVIPLILHLINVRISFKCFMFVKNLINVVPHHVFNPPLTHPHRNLLNKLIYIHLSVVTKHVNTCKLMLWLVTLFRNFLFLIKMPIPLILPMFPNMLLKSVN